MRKRGNNEGTIYQRRTGLWAARVSLPDGKRKSYYGKTREEAHRAMTAALRDTQQGITVPTGRLTLGQFLTDWLDTDVAPRVRPGTYRRYAFDVRRISAALGTLKLSDVTPPRVQAFLNRLHTGGLSSRTVQHTRAVLRSALTQAENWNLIARNPAAGKRVTVPRAERYDVPALTSEHARRVVAAFAGHPLEALIYTALATGLRIGELLGLRWPDVDLDAGTLTVQYQLQRTAGKLMLVEPKSRQSRRTLALSAPAVEMLRGQRVRQLEGRLAAGACWQDTGHVFTSAVGTPLDGVNVLHRFQSRLAGSGLPRMRIHDLRHGTASLLLAQGADLRTVMEQLGHSQIHLTANTYAHLVPALRRDAADKLGAALSG